MLLINPATEQFGGFLSRYVPVGIPVAIGTLAAYLKKFGHEVAVADDELGQLTERFARGTNSENVVGSGIGLTIVKEVIEAHGGTIHIENSSGGGACVSLHLPLS